MSRQAFLNSSSPIASDSLSEPTLTGERNRVALRPDQLLNLAQALNVSVEDLVGSNATKKRSSGPTRKMKQLFEAASQLPRSQQQKLAAVLEAFVNQPCRSVSPSALCYLGLCLYKVTQFLPIRPSEGQLAKVKIFIGSDLQKAERLAVPQQFNPEFSAFCSSSSSPARLL